MRRLGLGAILVLRRWALAAAAAGLAVLVPACFVEVRSESSRHLAGAEELASSLQIEFARKAGGATATVQCPGGLTGTEGHRVRCEGRTSDGFTLEIAVLERGSGAFRWDVVESHPVP